MRSDPSDYDIVAPANLQAAMTFLAEQPNAWLPIAGGTDVMVQFAAGTLARRKLLSIWNLPELRRIEILPDEIRIGAGCTYTDVRRNETVAHEFPLLARAAAWTGGIANQNRGTLGGNIVNASPAADSLPPLLAYETQLILVSVRGERTTAYRNFHRAYKQMDLAPDELIETICLPRRYSGYFSYARKVGARNAQAISKVCIAALGKIDGGLIRDARIALGSVAPVPIRLSETEKILNGKCPSASLIDVARNTAITEIRPIDDIRSTAKYRAAVVGNLVAEFVEELGTSAQAVSNTLTRWNSLSAEEAENQILPCCGSRVWARGMASRRPIADEAALLEASDLTWRGLSEADWIEAFRSHPRIGESRASQPVHERSANWSAQEQSGVAGTDDDVKRALAGGNREYEERFGRIFIVCASGKSAAEMLAILRHRLQNDPETELREAVEQQRQIAQIRLKKWIEG